LGQFSDSLHKNIGELAAKAGINRLYAVGNFSLKIAEGAMANGMERRDIYVGSKTEILEDMIKWLLPGDWILVKGSRSMGMEKIVDGLKSGIKTS
jgi:UDP-N-acetylmuramyl pentapeptide synthase